MKKIIIPRRDHEVYFIPVPQALKPKQLRSFTVGQMEKLHPSFSGETALDIKRLVFNKTRWIMATVMEAETLAEYRVLYKGSAFFTNTSIAVHKKDFISGGVQKTGDELIGFHSKRDSPVSIPLERNKTDGREGPANAAKNVTRKARIFVRRAPVWRVTAMISCAVLSVLIPLFFFPSAMESKAIYVTPLAVREALPESKYPPPAIELLAEFSADLAGTGGKMTRWQYSEGRINEESAPLATIQTRGIDVLSLRKIFDRYEYIVLEDITEVRYIDGEPYLTAFLSAARKGYLTPGTGTFFSQSFSLPIFADLTGELRRNEVTVVSETLPSSENGNALYTVTYTAKDKALIRSMEIITAICDKYPVRVKGMEVTISGEGNSFTVVCLLTQSDGPRYAAMVDDKAKIPKAFGYKETPPPVRVTAVRPQAPQAQQTQKTTPEVSIVGTIRDDRGQMLFYREAGDSKIMIKDTP